MFEEEKERQLSLVSRIEKVKVEYEGHESCTLLMNKGLSTPYNCAMHISELLRESSAVALVNGELWDMHRPLTEDCTLRLLHYKEADRQLMNSVNMVFWRSCSFILGYILDSAFKDDIKVDLCSFPPPNIDSGSFVYDADLGLPDWTPTQSELNCLSRLGGQLFYKNARFERLQVDAALAASMFHDNRLKSEQIASIAARASVLGRDITLYRLGEHVDICQGPLIPSTTHISPGRFKVAAVHNINTATYGQLQRIQGVAIPTQLNIHHWSFNLLSERATKLNAARLPELIDTDNRVTQLANGN